MGGMGTREQEESLRDGRRWEAEYVEGCGAAGSSAHPYCATSLGAPLAVAVHNRPPLYFSGQWAVVSGSKG